MCMRLHIVITLMKRNQFTWLHIWIALSLSLSHSQTSSFALPYLMLNGLNAMHEHLAILPLLFGCVNAFPMQKHHNIPLTRSLARTQLTLDATWSNFNVDCNLIFFLFHSQYPTHWYRFDVCVPLLFTFIKVLWKTFCSQPVSVIWNAYILCINTELRFGKSFIPFRASELEIQWNICI